LGGADAVDIDQIVSQLSEARPLLTSVVAQAIAAGILRFCAKVAASLRPAGASDVEQKALGEAATTAVADTLEAYPELADINFCDVLDDERVVGELQKAFAADSDPDRQVFCDVAREKGFDLSSLRRPLNAAQVFSRLFDSFRASVARDARLRLLRVDSGVERIDSRTKRLEATLGEVQSAIARLPTDGSADLSYVLGEIDVEYREEVERARGFLKESRFIDGKSLLETTAGKPTFHRTSLQTQTETHRLHGLACMRLGDLPDAQRSFAAAAACDPSNVKLRLNQAELKLRVGKTEKAIRSATLLLTEKTASSEARRILAVASLEKHKVDDSMAHLEACGDKDTPAWLSIRAACELERRDFDAALGFVRRALQAEPDEPILLLQESSILMQRLFASPGLQSGLAVIAIDAQRRPLEELRDTLQATVTAWDEHGLKTYSVEARLRLATAFALLGQKDEALQAAVEATQCLNAGPGAWLARARCEMESENRPAAAGSLEKARELAPNDVATVTLTALNKAEDGCPLGAAEDIDIAFSDDWDEREKLEARAMQASFFWRGGQREKALEFLTNLPRDLRQKPRIIAARCEYLLGLGRAEEAVVLLEDAVGRYAGEPVLLHLAGEAHLAASNYQSAIRRYARALRLAPNADSLSGIVRCCLRARRPAPALKLLELYAAKGIEALGMLELKARALLAMGRLRDAAEVYEEHIRSHPDDIVALSNAAACWWRLGRRDRMPPLLERVADIDPLNWAACAQLAQLYMMDDRKEEAFRWAREARARGGHDPDALLLFFTIALYTGHEDEAFPVLREIADRFPEYPRLIRAPEAEGIEMYRQLLQRGERVEQWYHERKLPITLVANALTRSLPLYRAIRRRAQLPFWADLGIPRDAERAASICKGAAEVVMDYPSLITLAQTNMFTVATRCFTTLHVPAAVVDQMQVDRLALNQRLSYLRERGHEHIRQRLERAGVLESWRRLSPDAGDWPARGSEHDRYLCEKAGATYLTNANLLSARTSQETPAITITTAALVESLWSSGKLTSEEYDTALQHLSRSGDTQACETAVPQTLPEALVIDFFALSTLEDMGLLQLLLDVVPLVLVSPWAIHHLLQETSEEEMHEDALSIVSSIEAALTAADSHLSVSDVRQELVGNEARWKSAIALAQEKGIPLWSDDLVTRVFHGGPTGEGEHLATRSVIEVAHQRGTLSSDDYHRAVVDLAGIGFEYCSFNAVTLVWSIARRNYQPNAETDLLLRKHGGVVAFRNVVAVAIGDLARSHEEQGRPDSRQLMTWMRELSARTGQATAGIGRGYLNLVRKRLRSRSLRVRRLWDGLVQVWESLGWYIRD